MVRDFCPCGIRILPIAQYTVRILHVAVK